MKTLKTTDQYKSPKAATMRTEFLALYLCLITGIMTAAETPLINAHPNSKTWPDLFTKDLSDANFPAGSWSIKDGELTASEDQCIWTKIEYENFIIDLEFKNSVASNSGVLIYCTDVGNWIPNSIEIQILDDYADKWKDAANTWKCAGIFGRLPPTKQVVKKTGEWNRMTIACIGPHLTVILNDVVTADADMKKWISASKNPDGSDIPGWLNRPMAELATKGKIGLQGKHGDAPITFRNYKIKSGDPKTLISEKITALTGPGPYVKLAALAKQIQAGHNLNGAFKTLNEKKDSKDSTEATEATTMLAALTAGAQEQLDDALRDKDSDPADAILKLDSLTKVFAGSTFATQAKEASDALKKDPLVKKEIQAKASLETVLAMEGTLKSVPNSNDVKSEAFRRLNAPTLQGILSSCQSIVKRYPDTKAARKAAELLEKYR